jgi:hypothetical protein
MFGLRGQKAITSIGYGDTPSTDAFGRARVSQIIPLWDGKQMHDKQPLFIDEELIGGATATHSTTGASTALEVSSNLDAAIMQTKNRFPYSAGKSQQLFWTFYNFDNEADTTKRVGYFSSNTTTPFNSTLDGFFLQSDGTNISVQVYRSGTAVSQVNRSDWDDSLDGNGASGVTHDFDNNTIMCVDFEWLGVGRIRWCIVKNGLIIPFHYLDYTDTTQVYMSSPTQPMRWESRASGSTGGTGFTFICSAVGSEGATSNIGKDGGIDDDGTHLDANAVTEWYYAIGMRLQAAKTDSLVSLHNFHLMATTNDNFLYRVLLNPTYASTVTYTDVTNYSVSYGLGVTANTISSDGTILDAGTGTANTNIAVAIDNSIRMGVDIDGTLDELVIAVKPLSVNLDIHRSINWHEN